jgi:hypothetical protein
MRESGLRAILIRWALFRRVETVKVFSSLFFVQVPNMYKVISV